MMSSPHVGYVNWDAAGWKYPDVTAVVPAKGSLLIVDVEGTETAYVSGTARLPVFTNLQQENYCITISNGGEAGFDYQASSSVDWIQLEKTQGWIESGETLQVSVDWEKADGTSTGEISISGAGGTVKVEAAVEWTDIQDVPPMTFIETHHVVSIEAEHTVSRVAKSGVEWKTINNYGRSLSSVKMFPDVVSFAQPEHAPYLEYRILVRQDADYSLTIYIAPTNNLSPTSGLRYAAGFDAETPVITDTLPLNFEGGNHDNEPWCRAVMDNIHIMTTRHTLTKGIHTLRLYRLDAGLVLQKLVLSASPLPNSYFGPEESFYTGSPAINS
ncbi:hypothetical protein [Paenibacillus donghaensis]|uniref:hypothetical protein n=1 Tax=Paenibacillus donghaensis TaxID=414771 RepID=UPI001FE63DE7|nr:hypothetical protein [Paenibacillus donghaensis]